MIRQNSAEAWHVSVIVGIMHDYQAWHVGVIIDVHESAATKNMHASYIYKIIRMPWHGKKISTGALLTAGTPANSKKASNSKKTCKQLGLSNCRDASK